MEEFVEHLRSVHFALLLVCGAIVAAIFLSDDSALRTARTDLSAIQGLQSSWDADLVSALAHKEASTRLYRGWATGLELRSALQLELEPPQPASTAPARLDLTRYYVSLDDIWRIGVPNETNAPDFARRVVKRENAIPHERLVFLAPPTRLKDFEDLWNTLEGGVPIEYISDIERLGDIVDVDAQVRMPVRIKPANASADVDFGPLGWSMPAHRQFNRAGVFDDLFLKFESSRALTDLKALTGENTRPGIVLKARPALMMLDVQQRIAEKAGMRWAPGTFAQTFPELSALLSDFKSIELAQADALLTTLEENLGDKVELLGVEVPAQALQVWALVLVLLLQSYLAIHIHQFKRLVRSAGSEDREIVAKAAWIGLYPQRFPAILTTLSACWIPVVLVISVRLRPLMDEVSGLAIAIAVFLLALSVAIAWYTHVGLREMRHLASQT